MENMWRANYDSGLPMKRGGAACALAPVDIVITCMNRDAYGVAAPYWIYWVRIGEPETKHGGGGVVPYIHLYILEYEVGSEYPG